MCVSLAEAVVFLSCALSRDSIAEVSRDTHSEGCQSVLCKSVQKCARFNCKPWFVFHGFLLFLPWPWQTELLPRCKDMSPLGEVLQRDGKLLTETILQVSRLYTQLHTKLLLIRAPCGTFWTF